MQPSILIVDDHAIVRRGLMTILHDHDYTNVREAANGPEALHLLQDYHPAVVLLDIALPGMRGIDVGAEILRRHPHTKVIFLTIHKDEEYVYQAMSIGASGYILKECMDTEIITAIQTALRGKNYLTPMISGELIRIYSQDFQQDESHAAFHLLTNREREILTLLSEGKTNKEVADALYISPRTVEHHRQSLMKKLHVASVPALIKFAIKTKLIEL